MKRAFVRVSHSLTYRQAQDEIDGTPRDCLRLLGEIGRLRAELEEARGAVSLALPAQEVHRDEHGHARLVFDYSLDVERWNAQISLLAGIAAAKLMLDAGIGLLRTLPPADEDTITALRRTAAHLEVEWAPDQSYAARVRTLNPARPREAALLMRSARGLRGAGYAAFLTPDEIPDHPQHFAIASTYSHVTAPLRRVCDRHTNEVVLAICAGRTPPTWAAEMLPRLPSIMGRTVQRERALERAIVDYMETMMLAPNIGAEFDAIVVNHKEDRAVILLRDPAVIGELTPKRPLGSRVRVKLTSVDVRTRTVEFELEDRQR